MRTQARPAVRPKLSLLVAAAFLLALALSAPPAHAQAPPYTLYSSSVSYSQASGYTPENVNFTWTNTDTCGSFGGDYPPPGPNQYDAPSASWYYGSGVGATPCTSSLPSGTITETITAGGVVLASCTDTHGAATFGNPLGKNPSYCTSAGTGVTIEFFYAQATDAAGNPVAAGSAGNYDWVIAVVVIIILIILLLFFYMRRKRKTQGLAGGAEAEARKLATDAEKEARLAVDKVRSAFNRATTPAAAPPGVPPQATAAGFCGSCGAPVAPGAAFCTKCGKAV